MSDGYPYQIEGARGEFNAETDAWGFVVTVKVTDVNGATDVDQMYNVLNDPSIPLIGSDLSGVSTDLAGCWNRRIDCTPLGDRQWRVTITYQQSPYNTIKITVNTQTNQVESNKDRDGSSIELIYYYPDDYGGTGATDDIKNLRETFSGTEGGTFSKQVPETTRTYELRETQDPGTMKALVGTINTSDWLDADDALKWMLVNVSGFTDNSQQSPAEWVNTYTFQYRVDEWQPEVVFTDSNTNEPVPDPVFTYQDAPAFRGSKTIVAAYRTEDFGTLFPEFS